ncbi:type II toxin-antitoxin system CcdA family antitoxin [Marivita sp. S2033]|uniref:type II toxin-antitoxin system CcdA family antitoxin n=1 Tax=Marivita sp. S2033 TaxID=3373187 RepID=UPI0039829E2C
MRKSTSLSLDADLFACAKAVGVNISRAAEAGIEAQVRHAEAEHWKEENKAAFDAYNKLVEDEGLPLAKYRQS